LKINTEDTEDTEDTESSEIMTVEMRRKLAAESYEEKIRKVGMLIRLVKEAPKLGKSPPVAQASVPRRAEDSGALPTQI
jgi:hypothetical protein